ncbi:PH domain-containing protein [Actinomycetospora callitridis]|uniref:PH domain-containing protein n=1 Tax=Actinomycetospora callitridis TaxID=913944 RepID=UPI002365BD38|nr:PH domain-containing protein [Actinomycetospora callitridis]MDD7920134.1 PH domain-containing protein [Actinomycetospora callitridis]
MTTPEPGASRLRAPAHRVSPRARSWWALRSAITSVGLLIPQVAVAVVLPTYTSLMILTGVATVVVGVAHLLVVPCWRYALHRWEITDDAVHTLSGWLRLEWRIAPISRVQTVDTDRGPLQRAFGLSSVTVTTASASGALTIDGLDADAAVELADRLTRVTETLGGDAT